MELNFVKLALTILGATGFWKLIEAMFGYMANRKLKYAEARNLNEQANSLVVKNWVQWSSKMEERLAELECKNKELTQIITQQREQIEKLKKYVDQLEETINHYNKVNSESK